MGSSPEVVDGTRSFSRTSAFGRPTKKIWPQMGHLTFLFRADCGASICPRHFVQMITLVRFRAGIVGWRPRQVKQICADAVWLRRRKSSGPCDRSFGYIVNSDGRLGRASPRGYPDVRRDEVTLTYCRTDLSA